MKQGGQEKPVNAVGSNLPRIAPLSVVFLLILVAVVYVSSRYSAQNRGNITLPGGITYLGPSPQGESQPTAPQLFTVEPDTPWLTFYGRTYPFSFSHPETLPLVVYINDPTDTVSIGWGNIPSELNVLLNIEQVAVLDPRYVNLPKREYVENWWQSFSGLKGVKSVTPFTNATGLRGYRARYFDYSDNTPIDNVFFEATNNPNIMIHLANGVLDENVFERIIHSVTWISVTPTPIISPS